jgi:transcriptional regulator with XRE-family HTH domain
MSERTGEVPMTINAAELRNPLRVWRLDHDLSLEEMAGLTGLSKSMLSRAERGERCLAPLTKVKVARRLGVPLRDLFEVEEIEEDR